MRWCSRYFFQLYKTRKEKKTPMSRCSLRAPVPACGRDNNSFDRTHACRPSLLVTPKLNAAEKMKSSKKEEEKHLVTPNPLLVIVVYLKIGKAK
jgi:hypothetical protein